MTDSKISDLTAITALVGTEEFVVAKAGASNKIKAANLNIPLEYDYVERTSALTITATTDATAQTALAGNAVSYDGSTRIKIEFYAPVWSNSATQAVVANLYDGTTDLGRLALSEANAEDLPVYAARFLTPSNASHTYNIKVWKTGGTASITGGAGGTATYMPAWMRITRA